MAAAGYGADGYEGQRPGLLRRHHPPTPTGSRRRLYLYDDGPPSHPVVEYMPDADEMERGRLALVGDGLGDDGGGHDYAPAFVLDVTWPRLVNFYHPDSQACLNFKPDFVRTARAIRRGNNRMATTFHAVSCLVHEEVCREYGVETIPSVMAFPVGSVEATVVRRTEAARGPGGPLTISVTVAAESLGFDINISAGRASGDEPENGRNRAEKEVTGGMGGAAGIEEDGGREGAAAAARSVNLGPGTSSPKAGVEEIGGLLPFPAFPDGEKGEDRGDAALAVLADRALHAQHLSREEVFSDAAASLLASLEFGAYDAYGDSTTEAVPKKSDAPMSPDRADMLRDLLDLLHWSLPSRWGQVHDLVNDLRNDFGSVSMGGRAAMTSVLDRHRHSFSSWGDSCAGAGRMGDDRRPGAVAVEKDRDDYGLRLDGGLDRRPGFAGYTCGVWNLLHIISVGAAEQHASVMGDRDRIVPSRVILTVRDFVEAFYSGSCVQCRRAIVESADGCLRFDEGGECGSDGGGGNEVRPDAPVSDPGWRAMAMFLWRVHNEARSGMTGDKVPWPDAKKCRSCHRGGAWDLDAVYAHLRGRYWPPGIQNPRIVVLESRPSKRKQFKRPLMGSWLLLGPQIVFMIGVAAAALRWVQIRDRLRRQSGLHKRTHIDGPKQQMGGKPRLRSRRQVLQRQDHGSIPHRAYPRRGGTSMSLQTFLDA